MLDTAFPIMQLSSVFQLDTSCLGTTQIFQTDQAPLRATEDMIQLFDWLSSTLNE